MMEFIASLAPVIGAPAVVLLIAIALYFKMTSDRKETKNERDKDSQEIHDTLLEHGYDIKSLKSELSQQRSVNEDLNRQIIELSKAVAQFSVAVDTLTMVVGELKQDIRDMRNSSKTN